MSVPSVEKVQDLFPYLTNVREHACGGQKIVFYANHPEFDEVVIKFILPDSNSERVYREIQIVKSNHFPNVPTIYDCDKTEIDGEEGFYIVEQYVNGRDLKSILDSNGPLAFHEAIHLLKNLLDTIVELEKKLIVHRDIKPGNILKSTTGSYWLIDFGIARDLTANSITLSDQHFGPHTPGYAAPEQIRNMKKTIDSRADLFSLGVVVYEALTGTHPFTSGAKNYLDIIHRTETLNVQCLYLPDDEKHLFGKFIQLLMEKFPSRRPISAAIAQGWLNEIIEKSIKM